MRESSVRIARLLISQGRQIGSMDLTNLVICRRCGAGVAIRINRSGFLQRNVLGHFGLFPWKCGACGCVFLFRRRGYRFHKDESVADSGHHTPKQSHT